MLGKLALQKTSLLDFPGRIAAVAFTPGCGFRCPYCHNPELALAREDDGYVTIPELLSFLGRRNGVLSGLVLSGGEPLLHEDLPDLAAAARGLGYAVKLDTNGFFPDRIASVKADYLALDVKTSSAAYPRVAPNAPEAGERVFESLRVARTLGVPYEVRITCAPGIVGREEMEDIAARLSDGDPVVLQNFRPLKTLDPSWMSVTPYPPSEMEALLGIARRSAPKARIRLG